MLDSHDYEVDVLGTGAKTGVISAPGDDLAPLDVASPPEFGGPAGIWSPEHLLVASIASCLMTTFRTIAANSGIEVLEYTDRSTGHLQQGEDRRYAFDRVTLRPRVVISSDSRLDRAERAIHKAETACLVARSICARVDLEPEIVVAHQLGT